EAAGLYPMGGNADQPLAFERTHEVNTVFASANGINRGQINDFWDEVILTPLEEDVVNALRVLSPEIERISLKGGKEPFVPRSPIVKISTSDDPIPLRSMGEGMNRMFGIALALVNAKDGMLLIDEVDTGLHYSVLPDLWKLIFEVAHRLNVQVFATSHSWDCIQAFQQAADDNKDEEGVLIRLENRKDGVGAVTFDERELAIVTREQIEVR
ncbi:MAG: AAA family ATPase, partial [Janthinobacterium lividum]